MTFSASDIDSLAIGHFSVDEITRAVNAFNGFAQLFDREWVAKQFEHMQCPSTVSYIRSLWEDWCIVQPLPQSEKLVHRWSAGIGKAGVEAEVKVFAYLQREDVEVELFPEIESGKVPECRFQMRGTWVYVEVAK